MLNSQNSSQNISKSCLAVFILSISYWLYLWATSRPEVLWDSLDYEALGRMFYEKGWGEFFRTGPNREPLYPLLIAGSMGLADIFKMTYLKILVILQFGCLFLTQWLSLKIFTRLKISNPLKALGLFYLGFSPAIVNFALSVYSEILILPLIPLIINQGLNFIHAVKHQNAKKEIIIALEIAIILMTMTLIKGVFELATPLFLLSFFCFLVLQKISSPKRKRFMVAIVMMVLAYQSLVFGYKSLNKFYNGNFTLTSRGPWAFYGFAARRTEPLTPHRWVAALATLPGEGSCAILLNNASDCIYWHVSTSDSLGMTKLSDLQSQGLKGQPLDQELMRLSKERILSRPIQYAVLAFLESTKIVFWESTRMAFVTYPKSLEYLFFEVPWFNYALRIFWAAISIVGLIFLGRQIFKARIPEIQEAAFLILSLVACYAASYSLFWINTRYALPMAPLFIITAILMLQRYCK